MRFFIDRDKFLPGQLAFWKSEAFMPMLIGGYGSGKTHIGSLRIIKNSWINKGIPNQYVSPSYAMARRTVIPAITGFLDRAGVHYNFNKTDHEFYIHDWDGIIWIGSGDNPDSLKGPNLATAGIDEPFIQKRDVLDQMLARCRHPEGTHHEIFLTGTAEELNWGYEVATELADDYGVEVINASTRDNSYLPSEYVNRLISAYSDKQIAAFVDGQFVNLTMGRAYEFTREKNMRHRPDLHGQGLPIVIGQDFNVSKMCTAIGYKLPDGIHWFDEIVMRDVSGSATEAVTAEINRRLSGKGYDATVVPDGTGKARKPSAEFTDHEIMRRGGLKVIARTNPKERARVNAVNKLWREGKMTCEPTCKEIMIDAERCVWDNNGSVDQRKDPERSHMSDAVGYPAEYYFPIHKPVVGAVPRYQEPTRRRSR